MLQNHFVSVSQPQSSGFFSFLIHFSTINLSPPKIRAALMALAFKVIASQNSLGSIPRQSLPSQILKHPCPDGILSSQEHFAE